MSEPAIALPDPVRDRAEALVSRFDSLICPASMERARTWMEAGLKASLDLYRDMTFAELIEAFPGGCVITAEIVETADRLEPSWSQGSTGEFHIDYVAFRLREACEACLAAQAVGDAMAAERAKYLSPVWPQRGSTSSYTRRWATPSPRQITSGLLPMRAGASETLFTELATAPPTFTSMSGISPTLPALAQQGQKRSTVLAPVPAGSQAARLRSRRVSGGDRQHGDRREAHGRLRRDPSRGSERSVERSGSRRPKGQGLG